MSLRQSEFSLKFKAGLELKLISPPHDLLGVVLADDDGEQRLQGEFDHVNQVRIQQVRVHAPALLQNVHFELKLNGMNCH